MSPEFRDRVNKVRERINLRIYDSKPFVTKFLRYLSVPLSLTSVGALIASYGYALTEEQMQWVGFTLKFTIGFYIFKYFSELFTTSVRLITCAELDLNSS